MNKVLDCTALVCPGPVMRVKKEVDSGDTATLEVVVRNFPAKENVLRFLASQDKVVTL